MSYLVLARKFRPKTFGEMVGQEHVVRALENALTSQRLHHAYLFTGTRGVGKTTVSRILAKSLNCQGPDGQGGVTAQPCGVCQACTEIDAGRFIDYTELDAASNRGVDEVQGLLEQAVYKPVQGRFKVFMIDEVHMLTNTAFNAMLKTLEEPPEYLKFVLATTDPQKVPVTVLSRCLQFNLRPMAPETVREHLGRVLQSEGVPADDASLRLLARAARGSMRDALSLTDQAIAFGAGQLQEATVRQMLGSADRSHVLRLLQALADGDGRTVVDTCEELRLQGLSAAATLEDMAAMLQRMAVLQAVPDGARGDDAELADAARLAAAMPADETQLLYSICLHGRAELGLAPDEYAGLTMVLLRLLAFKPAGATAEKKTPHDGGAGLSRAAQASAPTVTPTATPPSAPAPSAAPAPAPSSAPRPAMPSVSAAPARPEGERLRVVEMPPVQVQAPAPAAPVHAPQQDVVAVAVREQPEPGARQQPQSATGPSRLVPNEEGDLWHQTVQQLVAAEAITALARELALQAQLIARDGDHWMLRVERESLNQAGSRERLRAALEQAGLGTRLSVEVGTVSDSPARRNAAFAAEKQRVAEETVRNDSYVQSLVRDFGAKIVASGIKPL
ncbi:DNA polymerase III subunit gamma/tau [Pseudorhodoferax sp. Leaf274]|uniref:DNA polymerase III subunit gamma/tau n=1 Tax=Pseudorhodoferax sp. Leaf274 TaxID=1736318 RepID=UPI0007035198|nr:DNA polymerase III subunit gamma/tau [Pseudorhodoferax sp. Leaf274]KQP35320.1 DNA polymerase III subunit gamma/tau [Pseudorhodoferax sp. Leaf274]